MTKHDINSENSEHHWPYLQTAGHIVLDLGCGIHGTTDVYQSSPVYFGEQGANKVIGVDGDSGTIGYFQNLINDSTLDENKYVFIQRFINDVNDVKDLLSIYNPTVLKCDIEGYETSLYGLEKDDLSNITALGIEYHTLEILDTITKKIEEWGFTIDVTARFAFVDAPQMGVLFCTKNK